MTFKIKSIYPILILFIISTSCTESVQNVTPELDIRNPEPAQDEL